MGKSRLKNSMRNTTVGVVFTMLDIIFQFALKSVFIKLLGETYNGVNGLFTSILQVLNLAELGFASAVAYGLYKPLKEKNEQEVAAYMNYFAFVYRVIALVVTIAGLICLPFLQYLIADDISTLPYTITQIRLYFLFYLANTVCSYLLAYKRTIISADQNLFILSMCDNISKILLSIVQIIVLLITKNYYVFLGLMVARTVLNNIVVQVIASKKYPYLSHYKKEKLGKQLKKNLFVNINALMFHKVGSVVINGTISIVITATVGVVANGIYSNYVTIINGITTLVTIIFNSMVASIGNYCVDTEAKERCKIFRKIDFMGNWLAVFCMVCFVNLFNAFLDNIWLGEGHSFNFYIVVAIAFSAYITYSRKSVLVFRDAMGLFKKDWYKPLFEAGLGLLFAVIFGKLWGVFGIVIGYTIATTFIAMPIEAFVLFKYGLEENPVKYIFLQYGRAIFATLLSVGIYYLCGLFGLSPIADFAVRLLMSLLLSNLVLFLINIKNENLKYYLNLLKTILKKLLRKIRGKKTAVKVTDASEDIHTDEPLSDDEAVLQENSNIKKSKENEIFGDAETVVRNELSEDAEDNAEPKNEDK